jgi:hypothetical protein
LGVSSKAPDLFPRGNRESQGVVRKPEAVDMKIAKRVRRLAVWAATRVGESGPEKHLVTVSAHKPTKAILSPKTLIPVVCNLCFAVAAFVSVTGCVRQPNLSIISGNNQSGSPNLLLPEPLVVLVTDTNGTPLADAPVTFAVDQGEATLAPALGTSSRSTFLNSTTAADGRAQVFCRLGSSVGITSRINATVTTAGTSTPVTFSATSLARPPEGVVLEGGADSKAVEAATNLPPVAVPENEVEDGIIITRIDVVLDPNATVDQVNAALGSAQAGIVSMRRGSPFVTVAIPPLTSLVEIQNLVQLLRSAPGILFAFLGQESRPQRSPFDSVDPLTTNSQEATRALNNTIKHLSPTRFPAAWNAEALLSGCQGGRVTVLVADFFGSILPTMPGLNFAQQIPYFTGDFPRFTSSGYAPVVELRHGYWVTATLGALFDKNVPTGANPFAECIDFRLVHMGGLTYEQQVEHIANAMPAGQFIMNQSFGWATDSDTYKPETVKAQIPSPFTRAIIANQWKLATKSRWGDFLVTVAAGNNRTTLLAKVYSGVTGSFFMNYASLASFPGSLVTFMRDESLWAPKSPYEKWPPLRATLEDVARFNAFVNLISPADISEPAENVLMVGSTTSDFMPGALIEADSSNTGPDVKAVGKVTVECPGKTLRYPGSDCIDREGTSYAAPQVAGLASYLWLLSPELRAQDTRVTRQAIMENVRDSDSSAVPNVIDALAAVLSLDQPSLPSPTTAPVRLAIMDVNDDKAFDETDLSSFRSAYFDDATGTLKEPKERDYRRYDLNGDGFTGGSKTERFDLDRVGSTQFGKTNYSEFSKDIKGVPTTFKEKELTDQQILCYYAYSSLYQGKNPDRRDELLAGICSPGGPVGSSEQESPETPTETPSATPSATRGPCALTNHSICKHIDRFGAGQGDNTVVPIVTSACGGQVEQSIVLDPVLTDSRDGITYINVIPEQNPVGASPLGSHTAIVTFVDQEHQETLTLTFTFTMVEDPVKKKTWGGTTSISGDCEHR